MNNYEFCTQWVLDQGRGNNIHVLDYGCGAGELVKELRRRNVTAFGCDVFFEGGDNSTTVDPTLFDNDIIRKMEGNIIPFPFEAKQYNVDKKIQVDSTQFQLVALT